MFLYTLRWTRHGIAALLVFFNLLTISYADSLADDTLVRGGLPEFNSVDPLHNMDELHATVFSDLFEGLVVTTPEGSIAPAIAEDWKISADGKTYTFALRKASWSNGAPIVADQFVAAVRRALDPSSKASQLSMLFAIKNAEAFHKGSISDPAKLGVYASDEHTLSFVLHTPSPHFLSILNYRYLTPLLDERYNFDDVSTENLRNIPFNGPYTAVAHAPGQTIELKKNHSYWDHQAVSIPKVKYILGTQEQQWQNYLAGELDFIQIIPVKEFNWARKNIAAEILIAPQFSTYFYEVDIRNPALQDIRVRQALNLVIDREQLAESAIQPGHLPTESIVPPHLSDYESAQPDWAQDSTESRIHRAQSLMTAAGYSTQQPLKFSLGFNTSEDHRRIANAVKQQWQQYLPVEIAFKSKPWGEYKHARKTKNAGMINRYGWSGDYKDPMAFLALWLPDSSINYMDYDDADYQQLLNKAGTTIDTERRYELLRQAEKILLNDSVILPLFHYARRSAIKPRVYDWESNTGIVLMSKHLSIEAE